MVQKSLLAILCLLTVLSSFSQARQMKMGDARRRYLIYLPQDYQKTGNRQYPLVFNFHGGGMTMTEQMFYSGMNKTADKYNFIVVYPQGINQDWNVGFETSYQFGSNDVGFVDSLLRLLIQHYPIDERAVYATGLSRGGFFSQRLAAELPERFAAIASVGGLLPDSVALFHAKKTPIPMMVIQGTADEIVHYNGKQGAYKSAVATYTYWKAHNDLQQVQETETYLDQDRYDSTSVKIAEVLHKNLAVCLVSVMGGGHTWPGADPFNIGFPLGRTTQEIHSNELIWSFFSRFRKADP